VREDKCVGCELARWKVGEVLTVPVVGGSRSKQWGEEWMQRKSGEKRGIKGKQNTRKHCLMRSSTKQGKEVMGRTELKRRVSRIGWGGIWAQGRKQELKKNHDFRQSKGGLTGVV